MTAHVVDVGTTAPPGWPWVTGYAICSCGWETSVDSTDRQWAIETVNDLGASHRGHALYRAGLDRRRGAKP